MIPFNKLWFRTKAGARIVCYAVLALPLDLAIAACYGVYEFVDAFRDQMDETGYDLNRLWASFKRGF